MSLPWNPSIYLKFQKQRLRPALELLAQAKNAIDDGNLSAVRRVIDLGCGTGNIVPFMRWASYSLVLPLSCPFLSCPSEWQPYLS